MPIIVNNFEIVLSGESGPQRPRRTQPSESPLAAANGGEPRPEAAREPGANALRPEDIELMLRRFAQRRARLRAD